MDIPPVPLKMKRDNKTPFLLLLAVQPRSFWAPRHPQTPPSGPVAELSARDRQPCFSKVSLIALGKGKDSSHLPHSRL